MKLISIIIPVYNSENYIEKCISSVLNQTYKNIEIIVINDGSTDNSEVILNSYAHMDSRIRLISTENRGVSAARNLGIKESRGDYYCFVDADDYIDRGLIQSLVKYTDSDFDLIKYKAVSVDKERKYY